MGIICITTDDGLVLISNDGRCSSAKNAAYQELGCDASKCVQPGSLRNRIGASGAPVGPPSEGAANTMPRRGEPHTWAQGALLYRVCRGTGLLRCSPDERCHPSAILIASRCPLTHCGNDVV